MPYRAGIVRGLSEYVRKIEEIHFTHIRRRILKIKPSVGNLDFEDDDPITLIVDTSGLTILKKCDCIFRRQMET